MGQHPARNRHTATGIERQHSWRPVVDGHGHAAKLGLVTPDKAPLEFHLTADEREAANAAALAIREHVRQLNRRDTAQSLADALARMEAE